jgi:hypothetical protein
MSRKSCMEILFSCINKFEKLIIENCYDMLTICLATWKLRKLQGEWYWIWQGCNPIRILISIAARSKHNERKSCLGNFVFLYKTDLKNL